MPAASPPARAFTFVNKKPPSPTLFSAQKTAKSALDSHKNAYFAGSETASARAKQGRGSRYRPKSGR